MKKLFEVFMCSVLLTAVLSAFCCHAATEKTLADVEPGKVVYGLNKYDGNAQGTYAGLSEYDGYTNVKEIHTLTNENVQRALCVDSSTSATSFSSEAIRPGMKIQVVYKYVPDTTVAEEDTPTDLNALLSQKPAMFSTTPNLGKVTAEDNIVANEWATATFRVGDYVDYTNTDIYSRGRFCLLSVYGSGRKPERLL